MIYIYTNVFYIVVNINLESTCVCVCVCVCAYARMRKHLCVWMCMYHVNVIDMKHLTHLGCIKSLLSAIKTIHFFVNDSFQISILEIILRCLIRWKNVNILAIILWISCIQWYIKPLTPLFQTFKSNLAIQNAYEILFRILSPPFLSSQSSYLELYT